MPIKLPAIQRSACTFFTACGEIETSDRRIVEFVKRQKPGWRYFQFRSVSVRLGVGQDSTDKKLHCHVDVVDSKWHSGDKPGRNSRPSELHEIFHRLRGAEIQLDLRAWFDTPTIALPPIIQNMRGSEVTQGGVSVKVTGGRLSITGAPVKSIQWSMDEAGDNVTLLIESGLHARVTDSYLVDAFESMKLAFDAFVVKGRANANRPK
ncbi:MAG: hypothetical protein ACT4QC_22720 [Planctomycetaceae bacterium]